MRKVIRTCSYDSNSVSLFDGDRKNELGEMYCVQSGILYEQTDMFWGWYLEAEGVKK
jgi:hypothetical protein